MDAAVALPECKGMKMAQHVYSVRVIRVAAALAERYGNADVAAYGRIHFAEGQMWSGKFRTARRSELRNQFWFQVGRALGSKTMEVRRDIREARAILAD